MVLLNPRLPFRTSDANPRLPNTHPRSVVVMSFCSIRKRSASSGFSACSPAGFTCNMKG